MPTHKLDNLVYERRGAGPPLVLLHGIGHTRRAWDPVIDLLADHREIHLIDLPGHGDSPLDVHTGPLGVSELADIVEHWLLTAELDRPAVGGNSLGAAIALELVRRGAAGSAVALAPIGFWTGAQIDYVVALLRGSRALARLLRPVLPAVLAWAPLRAALLSLYFAHPQRLSRAEATQTVQDFIDASGVPAILPYSRRYRFEYADELRGAPVTIAWGTRDRLLIGGQARRAQDLLPTARHIRLPGCGHVPMLDDPTRVAGLLLGD